MKRYKIEYRDIVRSKPDYITEFSKSGKRYGVRICFFMNGKKDFQAKLKNDLLNGIFKNWWSDSKNRYCRNWKKNKTQGIQIVFKWRKDIR